MIVVKIEPEMNNLFNGMKNRFDTADKIIKYQNTSQEPKIVYLNWNTRRKKARKK